jgi:thiamine phosphate synthase YjbQ (UPF0047 family)
MVKKLSLSFMVYYLLGTWQAIFLMFLKRHHTNVECGCLMWEMRGMMGVGVKHSTTAVAEKKKMEI